MPTLIIAHANCEAVTERLKELRGYGFSEIYIFVDGYTDNGSVKKSLQRSNLIDMLHAELKNAKDLRIFFSETNLGVGIAVPAAVDWFFQQVEYGLVLEDDCSLLPFAKHVLDYCEMNISLINDSVVSLSSPFTTPFEQPENMHIELIEAQLFTSWGWICHRDTWQRVALREISLTEVTRAAFRVGGVSRKENFWLYLSWSDIWLSLRKNQKKLWAFRFTILLVLFSIRVTYPNVKAVQHSPDGSGTNVKLLPKWDRQEVTLNRPLFNPSSSHLQKSNSLDLYLIKNVQGASFISLITRLTYRIAKKMRIK